MSSGGPPSKKLKTSTSGGPTPSAPSSTGADESKLNEIFSKLDEVQEKIEKLNDEAAEEIVQIEKKYEVKRSPIYKERSALVKRIPNFWKTAMMNHPVLIGCFSSEDQDVLNYLEELEVDHHADDHKEGYKIIMKFKSNPWFKNSSFTKEIVADDLNYKIVSSKVDWKEGKDLTLRDEDHQGFFSMWFGHQDAIDDTLQELSAIIYQEIWEGPSKFYHGLVDVEEEEGEGSEGEEEA